MLTRLSVKNFRLLRDVTIDVEPGKPIVLIGPNSSGKSSVLQVLDLLGRCANEGLKKGLHALGGAGMVVTVGELEAMLEVEFSHHSKRTLRYGFSFHNGGGIDGESLHA